MSLVEKLKTYCWDEHCYLLWQLLKPFDITYHRSLILIFGNSSLYLGNGVCHVIREIDDVVISKLKTLFNIQRCHLQTLSIEFFNDRIELSVTHGANPFFSISSKTTTHYVYNEDAPQHICTLLRLFRVE